MKDTLNFLYKIIRVGFNNILPSIAPIIIYTLLSVMYNNDDILCGFSLTYFYQFLFICIGEFTVIAQLKSEIKEKSSEGKANIGVIFWVLVAIFIIYVSYISNNRILSRLFNIDSKEYTPIFIYGILMLALDYTIYFIVVIWQYSEKFNKVLKITLVWYISRIIIACIIPLIFKDYKIGLKVICIIQTLIMIIFLVLELKIKKFSISIKDGFKYNVNKIPYNIMLIIISILGINKMSLIKDGLEAYNVSTLCTDTQ